MTSTTLADFPTEILQLIFSAFCLHCRAQQQSISTAHDAYFRGTQQHRDEPSWYSLERQALFSLCLVSRRLREIAQPILYHEFVPGYGDSWRSALYSWDGRLTSFVRTVAQRRDLAALVKRIYVHPFLLKSIGDEEARDALEQAALAQGIELWRQLSANDLVTILIAQLPNLEHFSLQVDAAPSQSVRESGLRAAGISRLPLRTIDICLRDTPDQASDSLFGLDWRARAVFERATDVETLNLHMCGSIWSRAPIPSLPNLKTLRITYSRLREKDLEELLYSCAGLRTFVYDPTIPNLDDASRIKSSSAVRYLRRHRGTLKLLHLDFRAWVITHGRPVKPVISLRDFTVLEHLFLTTNEIYHQFCGESPADSQLLVQLLPPSIASLHLAGYIGDALPRLVKGLLCLADTVSHGQFPKLEEVKCDVLHGLDRDAVGTAFAAAGVYFGLDSWPGSEATLRRSDTPPP